MLKNIYKCTSHVSRPTTSPLRMSMKVLYRCDLVVELASRIQDLVQNESGELLAHGVDRSLA